MKIAALLVVAVLATPLGGQTERPASPPAAKPCREHPDVKPPCYSVHGRLSAWNGTPTFRIWIVGTNRMLGISEGRFGRPDYRALPPNVESRLSWDVDLFGDFVVCPFEADKPGVMRLVCVDSATHLVVRPRK